MAMQNPLSNKQMKTKQKERNEEIINTNNKPSTKWNQTNQTLRKSKKPSIGKNEIQKLTHQSQNRINTYLKNKDQNNKNQPGNIGQKHSPTGHTTLVWQWYRQTQKENPQIKIPLSNTPSFRKESKSPNILNEIYSTMEKIKIQKFRENRRSQNPPKVRDRRKHGFPGRST